MTNARPGFNPRRLLRLMYDSIERCNLRLDGLTVLTEAATGAYVVTPVLAAIAGAKKVYAIAAGSQYGTPKDIANETDAVARLARMEDKIKFTCDKSRDIVSQADIITNSGHVRPIDAETISWMKPEAVVSLMYETWEFRPEDLDIEACRRRGILVAGINERHPAVDVFSFLGITAMKLLLDAGVAVYKSHILILCDNPFRSFLQLGLLSAGASVAVHATCRNLVDEKPFDAVVVALQPYCGPVLSASELRAIAQHSPGVVITQYWGDLDREAVHAAGLSIWPPDPPAPGHMGILPSDTGPEAIVRLQTGGLKTGEILFRRTYEHVPADADFVQML